MLSQTDFPRNCGLIKENQMLLPFQTFLETVQIKSKVRHKIDSQIFCKLLIYFAIVSLRILSRREVGTNLSIHFAFLFLASS